MYDRKLHISLNPRDQEEAAPLPYGNDLVLDGYEELTRLRKPFGLTEFGPHRDSQGTMDYAAFIRSVREKYPQTTFSLPWHTGWSIVKNKNGEAMMKDPWIIDRHFD